MACCRVKFTFAFYLTVVVDEMLLSSSYKSNRVWPISRKRLGGLCRSLGGVISCLSMWMPGFDRKAVCGNCGIQSGIETVFPC
jgi:hypothetical protein